MCECEGECEDVCVRVGMRVQVACVSVRGCV